MLFYIGLLIIALSGCADNPVQPERDTSIIGVWSLNGWESRFIMVLAESGDYTLFQADGESVIIRRGTWQTENGRLRVSLRYRGDGYSGEYILDGDRLKMYYWWERLEISEDSPLPELLGADG